MTATDKPDTAPVSGARFWDRIAERYAARPVPDAAVYARKLEITRRYLTPDSEIVEVGCGTGSTAIAHAPHVRHVLATDISPRMIKIAREKAQVAGADNVTFRVAALEDLPVPAEGADAVLGLSILHLVPDLDAAVAKIDAMLRPGGMFVSSTACLGDGMRWFGLIAPVGRALGLLPLVRILTAAQIRDALLGRGYAIEHDWQPGDGRTLFLVARKPG